MPNVNPGDARTYNPAPTLWKYDPQTNILRLKLTDASSNTAWFPVQLGRFPSATRSRASFSFAAMRSHAPTGRSSALAAAATSSYRSSGIACSRVSLRGTLDHK
jgi:hypothetical protein